MEAGSEEEDGKEVRIVSKKMEPLLERISELLQKHGGRRRRLTVDDKEALRWWGFILVELSSLITSLSQMNSSSKLESDNADEFFLFMSSELASEIKGCLDRNVQSTSSLDRAAAIPHPEDKLLTIVDMIARLHLRYKYHLQDDDGDGERTSSSYTADVGAGNTFLVGIQVALRNKQLRWFMANRKADNKTDIKVISMVGPAGVGKTALAMEIYRQLQQNEGRHYFQCCATVKLSRKPDIKELLKHILMQIDEPAALASGQITMIEDGLRKLAQDIKQCLQEKRYLIVIDDIWNESDWDIIKDVFPRDSSGSRIVITTQLRSVAQRCCSYSCDGLVYEVKPLDEVDSEQLLCRIAFGFEDGCLPENLKQVCDEILRRCGGIPLFITGMAHWLQEHHISISTNYSLEEVPHLLKQFEPRLSPTYDGLPYLLKFFLLYMNMFPLGYMFDKDGLIGRWIDDGLFIPQDDDDAEFLGELEAKNCFFMLTDRNVITRLTTKKDAYQAEENCHWQVNYFMQQFLASKAAEKGILFTSGTVTSGRAGGGKALRRLSLHQPDPKLPALLRDMDLSNTRSLAISGKVDGIPLDKFSHLVLLDLEGWQCFEDKDMLLICKMFFLRHLILRKTAGVSKLPPEIKELRHLRTLDISHTQIRELPSQICELKDLRKLDLRSTEVRQLPEQFWKLQWLEHMLVGGDELNHYETATEIPEEIGSLPSLAAADSKVLAITWSFHQCTDGTFQQALCSSIRKFGRLSSLTIHCGPGCCMDFLDCRPSYLQKFKVTVGRFTRLPQWFHGLQRLTFIEITVCTLLPSDLAVLGNLPELEFLVLGLAFIPEEEIVIDWEGFWFHKLERLSFTCRVPWLNFTQGAMPSLTYLELKIAGSPASQESVPTGISNLRRLSDVVIQYSKWYAHNLSVKRTVDAVRKGVAEHRMPINLFINGIEDQEEYVQAVEEEVVARASTRQSEIEAEE